MRRLVGVWLSEPPGPQVMLVAGEPSGDMHAANLVRALRELEPRVRCCGMGSERMTGAGVELLVDASRLAVVGLVEVLVHYREIRRALTRLQAALRARRPDLLVLIDYPEFNLRLAATARAAGVKVLYYISPQVWAWRAGRVQRIARLVDTMAVVFPFEVAIYQRAGVPVRFVGHPLVDEVKPSMSRAAARRHFGLACASPAIGLFPGSRSSEIERLLPILLDAARRLRGRFASARFLLALAPGLERARVDEMLSASDLDVAVVTEHTYDLIRACDVIATASGTATLQIALLETPMAIVYKVSPLTYWIARWLVSVQHAGLVNIVAGERIVQEFIQHDARPERIAAELARLLAEPDYARRMRAGLAQTRQRLGEAGGSHNAARLVLELLREAQPTNARPSS